MNRIFYDDELLRIQSHRSKGYELVIKDQDKEKWLFYSLPEKFLSGYSESSPVKESEEDFNSDLTATLNKKGISLGRLAKVLVYARARELGKKLGY